MKYKTVLLLTLATFVSLISVVSAKEYKYKVSDIDPKLLKNARAVIRDSERTITIESNKSAHVDIHFAITILKEDAVDLADLEEYYDKFRKISIYATYVYDEYGNKIKKIGLDGIMDLSAFSGSLYDDTRIKKIDPKVRTVPFTVEYSFTVSYKSLIYLPHWFPLPDYNVSIEKSILRILKSNP